MKFDIGTDIKYVEKIQIWLKSGKNIGHLAGRRKYVLLLRRHYIATQALSSIAIISDSLSVSLPATSTGRICVNFGNGSFYENVSRKF